MGKFALSFNMHNLISSWPLLMSCQLQLENLYPSTTLSTSPPKAGFGARMFGPRRNVGVIPALLPTNCSHGPVCSFSVRLCFINSFWPLLNPSMKLVVYTPRTAVINAIL